MGISNFKKANSRNARHKSICEKHCYKVLDDLDKDKATKLIAELLKSKVFSASNNSLLNQEHPFKQLGSGPIEYVFY